MDNQRPGMLFYGHDATYPEALLDIESGRANITWQLRLGEWNGHGFTEVAGRDLAMVTVRSAFWPSVERNYYFDGKRGFWMVNWDAVATEMGMASGLRAATVWLTALDRDLNWRIARWLQQRGIPVEDRFGMGPSGPASLTML